MMKFRFLPILLFLISFLLSGMARAQSPVYDLLLSGGRVMDPKNKIDGIMDVAIKDGKVARVASHISTADAKKVVQVAGLIVAPGFIDTHTHVFVGSKIETFADGFLSVSPDDFSFRAGVTTVVDAGTSGWRNFSVFKEHVIDKSQTRVLAFLNIAGSGMTGNPDQQDVNDMDAYMTSLAIRKYPETIVGVKIGHYEGNLWTPFDRAIEAATAGGVPLFVECHLPQLPLEQQLLKMRPGDMITHSFEKVSERTPIVDDQGKLRPYVTEAKNRGILFDVGHGGFGFWFNQALPALKQGLAPNSFGTDLHRFSMNAGMKNMLNVMSKYMAMGMSLEDIIQSATWNPARSLKHDELGNLSEGSVADIAVISIQKGNFGFVDAGGNRLEGNQKLEAELTLRAGKVVWDLNGLSAEKFKP